MTTRKPDLTREEHEALGLELATMHDRLMALSIDLDNHAGRYRPAGRKLRQAIERLSDARSLMDDYVFTEHRGIPEGDFPYYPTREARDDFTKRRAAR